MIKFQNSKGPGQGHFKLILTMLTMFQGHQSWGSCKEGIQGIHYLKIVSEYDQEIPLSQTADKPMAPQGRAT